MPINNSNFINLIGRLGDNPSSRTLPSGQLATEFNLATNDNYKDRAGNKVERTEWHRIKAYGKVAEILDRYLKRGNKVSIVGTLRYQKWVDKFDQKRSSPEIIVQSFLFMEGSRLPEVDTPDNQASITAEPVAPARHPERTVLADESAMPDANDDLPF